MADGNSLTIRHAPPETDIRLVNAWVDSQTAGVLRIRSPLLHDNVEGIRIATVASECDPLLPLGPRQKLISQDTLVVELSGSATSGDIETAVLLIYYAELPGVDAQFITPEDLDSRLVHIMTVQNTIALGTAGGWSGAEALNAEYNLLKGNTDYCIIGYHVAGECAAIRYRANEFGNLGLGGPGNELNKEITANWFKLLSTQLNTPLLPVFNSANVANVLIDGAQDENGTDVLVSTILGELA
jgi:hypothetical protein